MPVTRFPKTAAWLIAAVLLVLSPSAALAALKVVATTSDLAWFAREVGGERVTVTAIAAGYQDPHYVEPKPSYIVALARADLLLHVGLELETGWLPRLLDGAHNPRIQPGGSGIWTPASVVKILERASGPVDRSLGDLHPFGNPHYWLSPGNAAAIATSLAEKLATLDAAGAALYRERGAALVARIQQHDAAWRARLAPFKGLKLITYHRTFTYFLEHFELIAVDCIEPRPGVPPSASHLAKLVAGSRAAGVKLLLIESFFDPRDARFVSDKSGIPLAIAPVSVGSTPAAESWFDVMEILVSAVEQAGKS